MLRFSERTTLSPADVVERVLKEAQKSTPDSTKGLPLKLEVNFCGQETWDSRYPRLTEEDRKEVIELNMEAAKVASSRARPQAFRLRETELVRYYCSSENIGSLDKSTFFYLSGEINILSSKNLTETIATDLSSHRFADISSRPIGIEEIRRKDTRLKHVDEPTENGLIMLSPFIVAKIVSKLPSAFDNEKIQRKQSFLHQCIGKEVGTNKVHIIDDASVPSGMNTRYFDARGVPPLPLTLIKEGVISDTYLAPEAAARQDKRPSGHLDFKGQLWPGNLLVRAGRRSQNMILADRSEALLASELVEPVQLDVQTGRLSLRVVFDLIGSDRIKGRVGERTIDCHLFDLFSCVIESANDQNRFGFVDACTWVLEGFEHYK